jgi:hypothetical protein
VNTPELRNKLHKRWSRKSQGSWMQALAWPGFAVDMAQDTDTALRMRG